MLIIMLSQERLAVNTTNNFLDRPGRRFSREISMSSGSSDTWPDHRHSPDTPHYMCRETNSGSASSGIEVDKKALRHSSSVHEHPEEPQDLTMADFSVGGGEEEGIQKSDQADKLIAERSAVNVKDKSDRVPPYDTSSDSSSVNDDTFKDFPCKGMSQIREVANLTMHFEHGKDAVFSSGQAAINQYSDLDEWNFQRKRGSSPNNTDNEETKKDSLHSNSEEEDCTSFTNVAYLRNAYQNARRGQTYDILVKSLKEELFYALESVVENTARTVIDGLGSQMKKRRVFRASVSFDECQDDSCGSTDEGLQSPSPLNHQKSSSMTTNVLVKGNANHIRTANRHQMCFSEVRMEKAEDQEIEDSSALTLRTKQDKSFFNESNLELKSPFKSKESVAFLRRPSASDQAENDFQSEPISLVKRRPPSPKEVHPSLLSIPSGTLHNTAPQAATQAPFKHYSLNDNNLQRRTENFPAVGKAPPPLLTPQPFLYPLNNDRTPPLPISEAYIKSLCSIPSPFGSLPKPTTLQSTPFYRPYSHLSNEFLDPSPTTYRVIPGSHHEDKPLRQLKRRFDSAFTQQSSSKPRMLRNHMSRAHDLGYKLCRDTYLFSGESIQEGLTPQHLKKAKLMFYYTRYPTANTLKTHFSDVKFTRATTSQLIKWFSNFREFYYIQMEKFARQALSDGITEASQLQVTPDSELLRALNHHYNKGNDFKVPDEFLDVVLKTFQEFFLAIQKKSDRDPSWKKAIYKVICKLDQAVPEFFKYPDMCRNHTQM